MQLAEILVDAGLVTHDEIEVALDRQQDNGGLLRENLVELGFVDSTTLDAFIHQAPIEPMTLEETGLKRGFVTQLVLRHILKLGIETASEAVETTRLAYPIVAQIMEQMDGDGLLTVKRSTGAGSFAQMNYALTSAGHHAAEEAMRHSQYVGPAPVTLEAFRRRVEQQRIGNERIDADLVADAFRGLVVPPHLIRKLGPAINSGRSILLYGPPGNGKTSLAERIGAIFRQKIFIPHAIEVEGSIIAFADPALHEISKEAMAGTGQTTFRGGMRDETLDRRWVQTSRPVVTVGGELTMDMLDLRYNAISGFYDAPLHMKALNGVFVIDDFGRQQVPPKAILNRWIVPMDRGFDFMRLQTGNTFKLAFDELVIFSTNMTPDDLMDPAFLRRIHYKLEVLPVTPDDFVEIMERIAAANGLTLEPGIAEYVIGRITQGERHALGAYQPRFLIDQVIAGCRFDGELPVLSPERLDMAIDNLFATSSV